jgi:hypothetical protein
MSSYPFETGDVLELHRVATSVNLHTSPPGPSQSPYFTPSMPVDAAAARFQLELLESPVPSSGPTALISSTSSISPSLSSSGSQSLLPPLVAATDRRVSAAAAVPPSPALTPPPTSLQSSGSGSNLSPQLTAPAASHTTPSITVAPVQAAPAETRGRTASLLLGSGYGAPPRLQTAGVPVSPRPPPAPPLAPPPSTTPTTSPPSFLSSFFGLGTSAPVPSAVVPEAPPSATSSFLTSVWKASTPGPGDSRSSLSGQQHPSAAQPPILVQQPQDGKSRRSNSNNLDAPEATTAAAPLAAVTMGQRTLSQGTGLSSCMLRCSLSYVALTLYSGGWDTGRPVRSRRAPSVATARRGNSSLQHEPSRSGRAYDRAAGCLSAGLLLQCRQRCRCGCERWWREHVLWRRLDGGARLGLHHDRSNAVCGGGHFAAGRVCSAALAVSGRTSRSLLLGYCMVPPLCLPDGILLRRRRMHRICGFVSSTRP